MGVIIYFLIGFIVFFFMYKKHSYALSKSVLWVECIEGWLVVLTALFWPVAIPMILMWRFLEWIYKKVNKQ